jgi:DNA repair exonuclease SbcCD nuclease subunit
MKFAFTADIHLSGYGQDKIEDQTNLPERLHSLKTVLDNIAKYCVENNIRVSVIGGDILHGKSIIHARAQDVMLDYFNHWSDMIKFYVIDGNHDLSGKGHGVVSALKPLRNIPGVSWIPFDEVARVGDILMVPYGPNMVDVIKKNSAKTLISHFGLSEGVLNSGISIVSDISLKDLVGKYELVLLGHYHKPQEIIREDISLYYVGSPIQLDWGEKNDEKRFLVVDTETLEVESIPTSGYKKHIELDVTNSNKAEIIKLAKEAKEEGHYVKVVKRETVELGIEDDFMVVDKVERDITNRGITSSMSQDDKFKRFLEIKEIPEDDYERYMTKARELVDKCEG